LYIRDQGFPKFRPELVLIRDDNQGEFSQPSDELVLG
jgi:hypothetical protein